MTENSRQIMANNIKKYMDQNHVIAADVCKACGIKQNTFSDWINGKTYPRIEKIEKMAAFFHCEVADLVGFAGVIDIAVKDPNAQAKRLMAYYRRICKLSDKKLNELDTFIDYLEKKNDD